MRVKIEKSVASGRITAPPSKSMAHRLLIAAAMCEGVSRVSGISSCEDVLATIDCLTALGAKITYDGSSATVIGADFKKASATTPLHCRESGSTLRFLIPAALLSGNCATFTGAPRLIERPHEVYEDLCRDKGLLFDKCNEKITVKGPLSSGEYQLRGDVSSQFITGLLFALPTLEGDSRIVLTTKVESRSYIALTLSAMKSFGVHAEWSDERTISIKGSQTYRASDVIVEGDYSGTAFIDALGILGGKVQIDGLFEKSLQGDRVYREHFAALCDGTPTISIEDCPDLGPILFTVAAAKNGAVFTDTKRLKIKESDRAAAMAEELAKFGADIIVEENTVIVKKVPLHTPTESLFGHNDHRIVMSLAVLSTLYGGEIVGAEAVKKSYPDFFEDVRKLGIKFSRYEI